MKSKLLIFLYLFVTAWACNTEKTVDGPISCIKLRDYNRPDLVATLLFTTIPDSSDSIFWLYNIVVPDSVLQIINKKGIEFAQNLNLPNSNFENVFYIDVYYKKSKEVKSLKIPMNEGNNYLELLITILKDNKIKDLAIAMKKLNYMKD